MTLSNDSLRLAFTQINNSSYFGSISLFFDICSKNYVISSAIRHYKSERHSFIMKQFYTSKVAISEYTRLIKKYTSL